MPEPLHSLHSFDGRSPLPPHALHVATLVKLPNGPMRLLVRTWPWPPHFAQEFILPPGSAPLPLQREHCLFLRNEISLGVPRAASSSVT
jgi:hypothetical protein